MNDLMAGLMAGGNFGSGFFQGQDQQQDRMLRQQQIDLQNRQYSMSMLMNQMKVQDEQKNLGYSEDRSAYAKQLASDPDTMDLPADHINDLMAKSALAHGDILGAEQFATNATNMRSAQVKQDQEKVAASAAELKAQKEVHDFVGGQLAAAAEQGEDAFNLARHDAMQRGIGTPNDQQQIANLRWSPDPRFASGLRLAAMNARDQAQTLHEQQVAAQTKKNQDSLDRNRTIRQQVQAQKLADAEATAAAKNKAGGGKKAPTKVELEQAEPYLVGLKLKPADFAQAQQTLVGIKKDLQKANPNLPDPQAFQQAAMRIKQDLVTTSTEGSLPFSKPVEETTYKMVGATPQSPIPYTGDKASLIPGRYYKTDSHGVVQFTGTGFVPVSGP